MPTKHKKNKSTRIFFTSDLWLGRNNIIDIFKRPFQNVEEMDRTIIEKWNTTVGDDDLVFILGNAVYDSPKVENIITELKGIKILMLSESDKNIMRINDGYIDELTLLHEIYIADEETMSADSALYDNFGFLTSDEIFETIVHIAEKHHPNVIILKNSIVDISRYGITISLYPLLEWNGKDSGTLNLHGGLCESSKDINKECRLSVRTDFWGFRPIELEEIQTLISQLKK